VQMQRSGGFGAREVEPIIADEAEAGGEVAPSAAAGG
jgi:hypothetical protein